MSDVFSFGVLGGDRRQVAMAEAIAADGHEVCAFGFGKIVFSGKIKQATLEETVKNCDDIILPIPVTADGIHLKMDFEEDQVILDDHFAKLLSGKQVFGGKMEKLFQTSRLWDRRYCHDYSRCEEFAVKNAVPTAEGALEIAIREFPGTVNGSRCLVAGFGRIGKILAWMLKGLGAQVTASARKQSDLAWIQSYGYSAVLTAEAGKGEYDMIFNTVPAPIFGRTVLEAMPGCPLMIDLASSPGGVDRRAALKLKIPVIQALALPGKSAPKAAGNIIKDTVYHILEGVTEA